MVESADDEQETFAFTDEHELFNDVEIEKFVVMFVNIVVLIVRCDCQYCKFERLATKMRPHKTFWRFLKTKLKINLDYDNHKTNHVHQCRKYVIFVNKKILFERKNRFFNKLSGTVALIYHRPDSKSFFQLYINEWGAKK